MTTLPRIAIYRDELLPLSETFILSQSGAYRRYEPWFIGSRRVPGLETPAHHTLVLGGESRRAQRSFRVAKLLGQPPLPSLNALRALQPALLHAHFGHDAVYALPYANRLNLPFMVTFHGYDLTRHRSAEWLRSPAAAYRTAYSRWVERLYPAVFRSAGLVLAVSQHLADRLVARGCPPEKVRVHYIGVDEGEFPYRPDHPRQPIVLFIGRLVPKKGVDWLIRAMSIVQAARPDVKLVIGGFGPLRPELESLAARSLHNVSFLGSLDHSQVKQWIVQAAVLCVPSVEAALGEPEGIPITVMEAQATGTPVVASNYAGLKEVIQDGVTGLAASQNDVAALAAALLRALEDQPLRATFVAAARRQVETRFSLTANTRALESLYDEVIAAHSLPR
ncbi:MAG: glycosyltransferase [Anaerolineae bacterium]|nr:MAG: glycosyltransferase [Anaerolineae bacterium]